MWLIISFVLGALLLGLVMWLRSSHVSLTWYEWVLGIVGLVLLLFTVLFFTDALGETESKAATMFLLVLGLPAVILLALSWQLTVRRIKKA
ncbi:MULTISPECIES: hypothetical protein [Dehalococcoides]|jgi:uncharacterized membrane protein|uniref:Reductive dehalogenase anchoring protein n=4 Tax=Dehalococcoides TaxID=61434 RepID=A0A142VC31_9CHLR|nr:MULTISPECIES: hypothetical protein [Dehalococcoides]AGG08545.1 putative reductive dehalogenase anchoring protein [Dehalococcoides mccartyi BTF08]AII61529.1 dehalogenase [Dehalococcoides mccartyi CG5]AMU87322.1 reductive dehalogenase anchoring protein [Dehalococcoides mccartyi]AQU06490.1 reductive dehalogenase membrane anchor [Dehalococcoides mccartyi]AQU07932.1 reductive dehalogenase membrane anchor [Dehalococcoides mccartyi]